jgi:hypothetical protein
MLICLNAFGQKVASADLSTKKSKQYSQNIFANDSILNFSLRGNLRVLLNDRAENPSYHPIELVYKENEQKEISFAVKAKTRGHFRKMKENCSYPPLYLNFAKSDTLKKSIFNYQDKYKLVMPCRGDEYVIREWLVYRLYNIITAISFQAKLVNITLDDEKSKKKGDPFFGILLEDEKKMAKKNGKITMDKKLRPEQTETASFLTMAVFQYLIGNTDWSIQYLQNIKLIMNDSNSVAIPVAYDFDHSGMVDAPYAHPAEELLMSSVLQRRYRGYCMTDMKKFESTIALFNNKKNEIYSLYANCGLINEKDKKHFIKYLDEFYTTINDPIAFNKEFSYPCDKNGTGNIVIKGLKEN